MKLTTFTFICIVLVSCKMDGDGNKTQSNATEKITDQGAVRQYLTALDTTQFPYHNLSDIWALYDWFNLKQIIPLPPNNGGEIDIRYLATMKSPFPANFALYIIGFNEGGDCGASYNLVAAKNGRELSSIILAQGCAWENENRSTTSNFMNDSTFQITTTGAGRAQDVNGYIPDKTTNWILTKTYKIRSNGTFLLADTTDVRWTIDKSFR